MVQGANPRLSRPEWVAVSHAFTEADEAGRAGGGYAGKVVRLLTGANRNEAPPAHPRTEAVQRFISETRRRRRAAVEYVPDLVEHGFNRAQIDALALLAA